MSKTIVVDGIKHIFPDDATDEEINAAIPPKANQQTLAPNQPGMQPIDHSLFDRAKKFASDTYDATIPGMISKTADIGSQYMDAKANERQKANEVAIAQGKPAPNSNAATTALRMGADTSSLISGANSPVGMATTGAVVAAPVTASLGLAGYGAYKAYQNKGALADMFTGEANPDQVREGLNGLSMVAGGAAGVKSGAPRSMENIRRGFNSTLVPGTPADLLTRATKPTVGLPEYEQSLNNALPEMYAKSNAVGKPVKSVSDVATAADAVKGEQWQKYSDLLSQFRKPQGAGPYNPALVDARPAADAQMESIPATNLFEEPNQQRVIQRGGSQIKQGDPGIVNKTKEVADLYRTDMQPDQADAIVRDSNAKLRETWNKIGGKRASALSNPETARLFSMDNSLRGQLYSTIEKGTGVNPSEGMNLYGDATDIGDTAARRATVFNRQQPFPLAQQISEGEALASGKPQQAILARMFKKANDSNWLAQEAFDRFGRKPIPRKVPYGSIAAAVASRQR
jgi:hypothetical protein